MFIATGLFLVACNRDSCLARDSFCPFPALCMDISSSRNFYKDSNAIRNPPTLESLSTLPPSKKILHSYVRSKIIRISLGAYPTDSGYVSSQKRIILLRSLELARSRFRIATPSAINLPSSGEDSWRSLEQGGGHGRMMVGKKEKKKKKERKKKE